MKQSRDQSSPSIDASGSSVGSTFGDVKRALLSRTSIDASSPVISGGLQASKNYPSSGGDGFEADERNQRQKTPLPGQLPVNRIAGGEDEVKHVRVRRGRRHSSDEDSDDDADQRTTGRAVGGGGGGGRPTSASSTSSSTHERHIKPPSPGSSAVRLSTGPIWDYRTGATGGSDRASQGPSPEQLASRDQQYASGYQRDARGMRESPSGQRHQYAAVSTSAATDHYAYDEAFSRDDLVRASMISCASSVGGINVVTSDEDDDLHVDIGDREVDEFTSDMESIASRSCLEVGETPTRSLPSAAFPPTSSPRYHHPTAATVSASPQTRRTLATAVRERADLALAGDPSSTGQRTTAFVADSQRNGTSSSNGDRQVVHQRQQQQQQQHQQRVPVERMSTSSTSNTGSGNELATIGNNTSAQRIPPQGVEPQSSRPVSDAGGRIDGGGNRGRREDGERGAVDGRSSTSSTERRISSK